MPECLRADFAAQLKSGPIPVSVRLPGVVMPQGLFAEGQFVWQVIDAIIAKFKLDITPQQLLLFKLGDDGVSRTLLHPMQTMNEAGILAGTKLVAIVAAPAELGPLMNLPSERLLRVWGGQFESTP